jgi:hypothetical protein
MLNPFSNSIGNSQTGNNNSYPNIFPNTSKDPSFNSSNKPNIFSGTTFTFSDGKDFGSDAVSSNQSIHWQLPISQSGELKAVFLPENLTYIKTKSVGDGPSAMAKQYTLSSLNAYLKSPEGRNIYGSLTSSKQIEADFHFYGVGINKSYEIAPYDTVQVYSISKRARVSNIFLEQNDGGFIMPRARCYVICRRYKFIDELLDRYKLQQDIDEYPEHKRRQVIGDTNPTPYKRMKRDIDEYYYQFHTYTSNSGSPPPRCLYVNKESKGHHQFIGSITTISGDRTANSHYTTLARDALHPNSVNTTDHHIALLALPSIELQIGIL